MINYKAIILNHICYTSLVYKRINKKLNLSFTNEEIEKLIIEILQDTPENDYIKTGKNIYVTNKERNFRITINSFTNKLITADKPKLINRRLEKSNLLI